VVAAPLTQQWVVEREISAPEGQEATPG
jgi:hypothetical protein